MISHLAGFVRKQETRIRLFASRPDVKANPIKAFLKRIYYRLRRRVTDSPWTLWIDNQFRVDVPVESSSGAYIFYYGSSEPEILHLLNRLLKPGMTFIDVGAHLGEYTLVASRLVGPTGTVHSFEPGPTIFPVLERNVNQNFCQNVQLHQMAVSNVDGELKLNVGIDPSLSRLIIDGQGDQRISSREVVSVPVVRLDTWAQTKIGAINLLKIDVEGLELLVLRGAEAVLSAAADSSPMIIFEYVTQNWGEYDHTFEEANALLGEYDYSIYAFSSNGAFYKIDTSDRALSASAALNENLLALKPQHLARLTH